MKGPSKKVLGIEQSPTLTITAKAAELKAQGIDVIGFGAGEPDFGTPDHIKEAAIKAINDDKTRYTPVGGIPELKDAVIEKFKRDNSLDYSRSEILVSCGGKHSIYNLLQALIDEGDEIIIPAPYWVSYPPMVKLAGGAPKIIETDEATGFKITPEQLRQSIGPATKALILNSPSNPTGAAYTKTELEALVEVLLESDIYVLTDEIYEKLVYDCGEHHSIASLSTELKERTIVLNGVSKAYAMTGWRIGYAAGPADIIAGMTRLQSQSTSNPTSISQWAAVEALNGPQDQLVKMAKEFQGRRDVIVKELNAINGIRTLTPEGAFYAFPNVNAFYGRSFNNKTIEGSLDLTAFLLDEAGVAVVPGVAFGSDANLRLSYACSVYDIMTGLDRIAGALEKLD